MEIRKSLLPLDEINGFSSLLKAYLSKQPELASLYAYTPDLKGFEKAISEANYTGLDREYLVSLIQRQYREAGIVLTDTAASNVQLLKNAGTFTICTGHQLCLFTGPLYFIYKIISAINLAESLSRYFPDHGFVPVYWMASEDHDFDEINHVQVFGKKLSWDSSLVAGAGVKACGQLSTASLNNLLTELNVILGESAKATELFKIFSDAYAKQDNLASATRVLVHHLL
ncbi:MAG TPA: bacillithiol biosynthesis BshC, partial [Bacteroidia bacterium]|nr:bacillithiol biosynthesis BshC [Bacteroidia bacterium]